jgi:hypothetical protein
MTNLATSIASKKIGFWSFPPPPEGSVLKIFGTAPQTIYVKYQLAEPQHNSTDRIGFSLERDGGFEDNINWIANKEEGSDYAMFITYIFLSPEIQEIECATLDYSSAYRPTPDAKLQQHMCVPWGRAAYAFDVVLNVMGFLRRVDPIIVVTPQ